MMRITRRRFLITVAQIALLLLALSAWQFLPQIPALQRTSHLFDSYFVSSPTRVGSELRDLLTGHNDSVTIWEYVWPTVYSALLGTVIGMVLGALFGLVLSNFTLASAIVRPFVVAANATPRVALIPIVVIVFGPSLTASVIISVLVVFFVAFFAAFEGGTSIQPALIHNARLLGAGNLRTLFAIRMPYVGAWTLSSLPLAVTFAIISVVTGEILTGTRGMGELLVTASSTGNSSLTFAVVIVLAVVGLAIVAGAEAFRRRVLHWWAK